MIIDKPEKTLIYNVHMFDTEWSEINFHSVLISIQNAFLKGEIGAAEIRFQKSWYLNYAKTTYQSKRWLDFQVFRFGNYLTFECQLFGDGSYSSRMFDINCDEKMIEAHIMIKCEVAEKWKKGK